MSPLKKKFVILDGPPYTSGNIHIGTAYNKFIKGLVFRYQFALGSEVLLIPGFDMHGLPIEYKVEKSFKIKNKKEIIRGGLNKFIFECKQFAEKNLKKMVEQFKELEVPFDWTNIYKTIDPKYIEGMWEIFFKLYTNNNVYNDLKVLKTCIRCETVLAGAEEITKNEVVDSIYLLYPVLGTDFSVLVWTTTLWTLPNNEGIAFLDLKNYVMVKSPMFGKFLCLKTFLNQNTFKHELIPGPLPDLTKFKYDNLFGKTNRFYLDTKKTFVKLEETGFVHLSPTNGPEDFEFMVQFNHQIKLKNTLSGIYLEGLFKNKKIFGADLQIEEILIQQKKLFLKKKKKIAKSFCWRCGHNLVYIMSTQWFISVKKALPKLISEVNSVNWRINGFGKSQIINFLEQKKDWCISRQRFWGVPIPLWVCGECNNIKIISKLDELPSLINYYIFELDQVHFVCTCGGKMSRVEGIFDVWFDSACAFWNLSKYVTFGNTINFVSESHDQLRGWFYSSLVVSVLVFGKFPFKNILTHGWILDGEGTPMSKSKGNIITPSDYIQKNGINEFIFKLFITNPNQNIHFSSEPEKKFIRFELVLTNLINFYLEYEKIYGGPCELESFVVGSTAEQNWLLNQLITLKKNFIDNFDNYNFHLALSGLVTFLIDDFSKTYLKFFKRRIWDTHNQNKLEHFKFTKSIILEFLNLLKIFLPTFSLEKINLLGGSRYNFKLQNIPDRVDSTKFVEVITIIDQINFLKTEQKIKKRWPIKTIYLPLNKLTEDCLFFYRETRALNYIDLELAPPNAVLFSSGGGNGAIVFGDPLEMYNSRLFSDLLRNIQNSRKKHGLDTMEIIKIYFDFDFKKYFSPDEIDLIQAHCRVKISLTKFNGIINDFLFQGSKFNFIFFYDSL